MDFSGIWSPDRNFIYDLNDALKKGELLPLQPWAEKLARERLSKDDPEALCLPTGVPRQAPYPWRIAQTATHMFFLFEGNIHSYRQIFLDGRKHPDGSGSDLVRPFRSPAGTATRWSWIPWGSTTSSGSTSPGIRTPRNCTSSNATAGPISIISTTTSPSTIPAPTRNRSRCTATPPISTNDELMEYICNENNKDVSHIVGKDPRNRYAKP